MSVFDLQADPMTSFTIETTDCGEIIFAAELYMRSDDNEMKEVSLNQADSLVFFFQNGTFTVETSDFALVGLHHELRISAHLLDYPAIMTPSVTILPLEFQACPAQIFSWSIEDVQVPPAVAT